MRPYAVLRHIYTVIYGCRLLCAPPPPTATDLLSLDPEDVAKIALEYNYPVWYILEKDYPDGMWEDLGRKFGLATVCSIDL